MIHLKNIRLDRHSNLPDAFPFNIPAFQGNNLDIEFKNGVTFFIGENGSGKTTLLEAISKLCGFNLAGGNRNHNFGDSQKESRLASTLKLSWSKKITNGFFMRAENFFNFASYLDELVKNDPRALIPYGNKSLHHQSHGEAFLSLFKNKFKNGIFLLDEPEAALSPLRQLSFLSLINELEKSGGQFIIATHSPIILSYPTATILELSNSGINKIEYLDTEHYRLTKEFLNNPERYYRHLFFDTKA